MAKPSTAWDEKIPQGEDEAHKALAQRIVDCQQKTRDKQGPGRALHRKQIGALSATLEVKDGLPEHACHGLFAAPGSYEVRVRLSNGSGRTQSDKTPDVRGFAFSVQGVQGESALGGPATAQDFLLIPSEAFAFKTTEEFVEVAEAASRSPLALLGQLIRRYGFFGGLNFGKTLADGLKRPFPGFLSETFFSAAPIACGPYAARVRLLPGRAPLARSVTAPLMDDVRAQLEAGPSEHELQLQFFCDESVTPILDPTVNWPEDQAPYLTVATLRIEPQDLSGAEHDARAAAYEAAKFDPWQALAAHRPLGEIMRARKHAYFFSQQARK